MFSYKNGKYILSVVSNISNLRKEIVIRYFNR